jgi:hypothetical protein
MLKQMLAKITKNHSTFDPNQQLIEENWYFL